MSYRVYNKEDFSPPEFFNVLKAIVIPRPIAWVVSKSETGVINLAPHSFFNLVSPNPTVLAFSSIGEKDTLRNVRATKEFVVHIPTEPDFKVCNDSSAPYPPEESEISALGLETAASTKISVPRLANSPIAVECRLHDIVEVGVGKLVLGEVLHIEIDEAVLRDDERGRVLPDAKTLAPITRMGRNEWGTLGEVWEAPDLR